MKRLLILLLCLSGAAHAEHITDQLVVGLYEQAALEGEPLQLLTSGTPVEVLERGKGVLKIRLADDTQGWVESGYVTDDKPAAMQLLEVQAELRRLKRQLGDPDPGDAAGAGEGVAPEVSSGREAELEAQLEQARERIQRLEVAQADLLAARMAQQKLEALRKRVDEAVQLLGGTAEQAHANPVTGNQPDLFERYLPWVISGVMLLVGFAAGVGFIDYRIRRRYGGFRI
jgi:SH3 domain protein